MSEKYSEFIGYHIKIKCEKCICVGEIVSVDPDTIVLTNASINEIMASPKFLGINQTLIHAMDIIKPSIINNLKPPNHMHYQSLEMNKALNVYTSDSQPPVIKKGGPSSAVHRNLLKSKNKSQENILKSRITENNARPLVTVESNVIGEHYQHRKDIQKSVSYNLNKTSSSVRKTSAGNIVKIPNWTNTSFNTNCNDRDFDFNLAQLDDKSNNKKKRTENSDSSDSGGITVSCAPRNGDDLKVSKIINIEFLGFSSRDNGIHKSISDIVNQSAETKSPTKNNGVSDDLTKIKVVAQPITNGRKEYPNTARDHQATLPTEKIFQQSDIAQTVTKSQLCNSDLLISDHSSILSIKVQSKDFQNFHDFWKIDNECKFPVFTAQQRDKIFECANNFGYDIREIAQEVGIRLSDFILNEIETLSRSRNNKMPKVAVLLGRCQTSVFVTCVAKNLLNNGCYVTAYLDNYSSGSNSDMDMEIKLLNSAFSKFGSGDGFNYLTSDVKELSRGTFDYIISGLDGESDAQRPSDDIVKWCLNQGAPILIVNPPNAAFIPWKSAAFVGVPTSGHKNLVIRTRTSNSNGGQCKKPDGSVLLFDVNLPRDVYNLLNLSYRSPFHTKNWIRLYREYEVPTPQ